MSEQINTTESTEEAIEKRPMSDFGRDLFNFATGLSCAALLGQALPHTCSDRCRDPLDARTPGSIACLCECHEYNRGFRL